MTLPSGECNHPCSDNLSGFQKQMSKHMPSEGMCLWEGSKFCLLLWDLSFFTFSLYHILFQIVEYQRYFKSSRIHLIP